MKLKSFDDFWTQLHKHLKVGDRISHWSITGRYKEAEFFIIGISSCYILIETSKETRITIPKADFESIFLRWNKYLEGEVLRKDLRDIPNRNTTYVISVLHMLNLKIV